MDCFIDTDKVSLHIDDILEEKRTAQKLFDTIQNIKHLTYAQYNVDSSLSLKFQHLIENADRLVTYYSKLASAMDETSYDAENFVKQLEQILIDTKINSTNYIDINVDKP